MSRFNDDELIDDFMKYGHYPKIHDDIFDTIVKANPKRVADIGCCFGLLSHRIAKVCERVIGIEPSEAYLKKAVKRANVEYYNIKICKASIDVLKSLMCKNKIDTVVCRRVIPELYETEGFDLVDAFFCAMHDAGVKQIVLEGRKSNKNAVNPLYCADKEVERAVGYYSLVYSHKHCRVLRRNK